MHQSRLTCDVLLGSLSKSTVRVVAGAVASTFRHHSHHSLNVDDEIRPQQQQRQDGGIAAQTLDNEASVAMQDQPPKRGRYQPRRVSGVQLEVLNLYRSFLKETRKFDDPATKQQLGAYVRKQFREHQNIPRKLLSKIEWQMHYGRNKLDELRHMRPNAKFQVWR